MRGMHPKVEEFRSQGAMSTKSVNAISDKEYKTLVNKNLNFDNVLRQRLTSARIASQSGNLSSCLSNDL